MCSLTVGAGDEQETFRDNRGGLGFLQAPCGAGEGRHACHCAGAKRTHSIENTFYKEHGSIENSFYREDMHLVGLGKGRERERERCTL